MKKYGLLGKSLVHSFSKAYFTKKFKDEIIHASYENYETDQLPELIPTLIQHLEGFNVTIPYKQAIIPFLDTISPAAKTIGAVNAVTIKSGQLHGFNTDHSAFSETISAKVKPNMQALVFGSGGASKAICYALSQLNISYNIVSRWSNKLCYTDLTEQQVREHKLLINTTPLGTFPDTNKCVRIPYSGITSEHLVYDLVYNPVKSKFLAKAQRRGAQILNGYDMLKLQAEESWTIWTRGE